MSDEPPNKKSKKIKRVKSSEQLRDIHVTPTPVDSTLLPLTKLEQINIEHVFAQALESFKDELLVQKKHSLKDFNRLALLTQEYLSCFSLVGFSLTGEKICIFNASTPKDESALLELLRSTLIDIVQNKP
jgi:hypothetical protein